MAMEAGDLIATLHGKCLRLSVDILGQHKQGLSAAARQFHLGKKIGANLKRKMIHLDLAYHVSRHITISSVEEFYEKLRNELSSGEVAEKVSECGEFAESTAEGSRSHFSCMSESVSEPDEHGRLTEPDPADMQPPMTQLPACPSSVTEALDHWLYEGLPMQDQHTSDSHCPISISYFIGDQDSGVQLCEQGIQTDMSIHRDATIVIPSPLQAVTMGLRSLDIGASQNVAAVLKDHECVMRSPYESVQMPIPNGNVLDQTAYLDDIVHTDNASCEGSSVKSLWSDTKYNGQLVVKAFCAWLKAYRRPLRQVYEPTWMHTLQARSEPSPSVNWSSFGALGHERLTIPEHTQQQGNVSDICSVPAAVATSSYSSNLTEAQHKHWEDYCKLIDHLRSLPARDVDWGLLSLRTMDMTRKVPQSMAPMVFQLIDSLCVKRAA